MPRSHSDLSFWKGPPRSFGGPFFVLHTVSVLRPPCLALRASIVAALLREIRPVAVAGGRVSFCGVSLALAGTRVSFSGSAPLPLLGPCAFRRFCPVGLVGSCGFACLLCGGAALLPSRWILTVVATPPVDSPDSRPSANRLSIPGTPRWASSTRASLGACRSDLPVAKTKISLFLQLFFDCGSLSAPKRGKWTAKQRILLRFCSFIGIQGSRNNPQSQKSCRKPGIFVFSLPGTAS